MSSQTANTANTAKTPAIIVKKLAENLMREHPQLEEVTRAVVKRVDLSACEKYFELVRLSDDAGKKKLSKQNQLALRDAEKKNAEASQLKAAAEKACNDHKARMEQEKRENAAQCQQALQASHNSASEKMAKAQAKESSNTVAERRIIKDIERNNAILRDNKAQFSALKRQRVENDEALAEAKKLKGQAEAQRERNEQMSKMLEAQMSSVLKQQKALEDLQEAVSKREDAVSKREVVTTSMALKHIGVDFE